MTTLANEPPAPSPSPPRRLADAGRTLARPGRASAGAGWALSALRTNAATLVALTVIALGIRLVPWLAGYPLHHDEALYGAWARLIATGRDPLLLTPWVDKPPLTLFLIAGAFRIFGVSELTLRLPGMMASLLLVPAAYGLARRAYGARHAVLAALLVAFSPFAISFAPTAFTDGWLTLWLVLAAWAALAGRGFVAGVLVGLAVASKQQGVLALPLVVALLAVSTSGLHAPGSGRQPRALRFLAALGLAVLGFALIFGPITWWDSLRWHNRPSFWDRSLQTYGPLILAPFGEWSTRLAAWAQPARYLYALPLLSAIALLTVPALVARGLRDGRAPGAARLAARVDVLVGGYILAYLLLHIAVTFQPWDRYLLPLVPLLALACARAILAFQRMLAPKETGFLAETRFLSRDPSTAQAASKSPPRPRPLLLAALLLAALLYPASLGASGRLPIGSDRGSYAGVAAAADALKGKDQDAIIYYRSLGWHLDFYLFDAPQERRWYGDGFKLAKDAGETARRAPLRAQWLILPAWEEYMRPALESALARQALVLLPETLIPRPGGETAVTLYRVIPAPERSAP